MKKIILAIGALTILSSCAHHRDVRPGADGVNYVSVNKEEGDEAQRDAIRQAEHYCSEVHKKHAVFTEEKTKYKGEMDENTRKTVKKASTAAAVIGSAVGVFGGDQPTRTGGAVLGGAGTVGGIMTSGNDYNTEMKFKCQ
jgi:hypothetical protein